jgi:hypothetical protein
VARGGGVPRIVQPEQIDEAVAKLDQVLSWVDAVELPDR